MRAAFGDGSGAHDRDAVGAEDGAQFVRDGDHGAPRQYGLEGGVNLLLGGAV